MFQTILSQFPTLQADRFTNHITNIISLSGMDERFKEYPKLKELIRLKVGCTVAWQFKRHPFITCTYTAMLEQSMNHIYLQNRLRCLSKVTHCAERVLANSSRVHICSYCCLHVLTTVDREIFAVKIFSSAHRVIKIKRTKDWNMYTHYVAEPSNDEIF